MPFGILGQTDPGMRQIVGFGDQSTGRGTFGANLGRAIVTNGDFKAYVWTFATTRPSSYITLCRFVFMPVPTTGEAAEEGLCFRVECPAVCVSVLVTVNIR